jgi:hypothetical protein
VQIVVAVVFLAGAVLMLRADSDDDDQAAESRRDRVLGRHIDLFRGNRAG